MSSGATNSASTHLERKTDYSTFRVEWDCAIFVVTVTYVISFLGLSLYALHKPSILPLPLTLDCLLAVKLWEIER